MDSRLLRNIIFVTNRQTILSDIYKTQGKVEKVLNATNDSAHKYVFNKIKNFQLQSLIFLGT